MCECASARLSVMEIDGDGRFLLSQAPHWSVQGGERVDGSEARVCV
jgi:hypothetical protein